MGESVGLLLVEADVLSSSVRFGHPVSYKVMCLLGYLSEIRLFLLINAGKDRGIEWSLRLGTIN